MHPVFDPLLWLGWTTGACMCVLAVAGTLKLLVLLYQAELPKGSPDA